MSRENVAIVRLAYEQGYLRRSVDDERLREVAADDFRFHSRPEFPGGRVYHLDEMPQLWADLDETYTEYGLVPEAFVEVDEYVVVTLRQSARLKGSDTRIEQTICHVWHIREGKAREAWAFADRRDAMEMLGLR